MANQKTVQAQSQESGGEVKKGLGKGMGLAIGGCLGCLGIIIILVIIGAVLGGGKSLNKGSRSQNNSTVEKKVDDSFYSQIKEGQTKAKVTQLAGKDPYNCSASSAAGLGETEICSWGDLTTFVTVTFYNGGMHSKSKSGF